MAHGIHRISMIKQSRYTIRAGGEGGGGIVSYRNYYAPQQGRYFGKQKSLKLVYLIFVIGELRVPRKSFDSELVCARSTQNLLLGFKFDKVWQEIVGTSVHKSILLLFKYN